MRFSTFIFALFAASVTYASGTENTMKLFGKNAVEIDIDNLQGNDKKCMTELEPYEDCIDDPTPSTLDTYCTIFLSDNCQKFYKDPMSFIPNCKGSQLIDENLEGIIKSYVPVYNLACQKDEVGNPCPFSEVVIKTFTFLNSKELNEKMDNTCRSNICREATLNAFAENTEFSITGKKSKHDYLNSDDCKNISGAASLKIGSGILISIGLLLLSLY